VNHRVERFLLWAKSVCNGHWPTKCFSLRR
jgi:hypothetical protein